MRFDVVANQHWCCKDYPLADYSDLAVAPALFCPDCPGAVRIDDFSAVRRNLFAPSAGSGHSSQVCRPL